MPRGSRATQVLTWVAAAAVLLCFLTFLGCTVAAVSVLPGVRAKSLPVATFPPAATTTTAAASGLLPCAAAPQTKASLLVCNPACNELWQTCTVTDAHPHTPTCVGRCPALCANVPLNTMCLFGHQQEACFKTMPTGPSTALLLQSAQLAADGKTTLALTAVPSSDPATLPPTFALAPAQLNNPAQWFTFLAQTPLLCNFAGTDAAGRKCPCFLDDQAWGGWTPGDLKTGPTPLPKGSYACSGKGLAAPCKNPHTKLRTAVGNPAGEWMVAAAPTPLSGSATAPVKAIPFKLTHAWRELAGAAAHVMPRPADPAFPSKAFAPTKGWHLFDWSFDRAETNRTVQLQANGTAVEWAPTAAAPQPQPLATSAIAANTWFPIAVSIPPSDFLSAACPPSQLQAPQKQPTFITGSAAFKCVK